VYSKVLDHSSIEGEDHTKAEVLANIALLRLVFGDSDHSIRFSKSGDGHAQNAQYSKGKVTFFDFDIGSFSDNSLDRIPAQSKSVDTLTVLETKLSELRERVSGTEGLTFLQAIIHHVYGDGPSFEYTPEVLQREILARLDMADSSVEEAKKGLLTH